MLQKVHRKLNFIKKRPSALFRFSSPQRRMLYTKIASQLKRKSFLERTLILSEMNFNSDIFDVTMMARDGFYLGNAKTQLRIMDRVLSEAELDLKHHLADGSGEQGKNYLQKINWQSDLDANHPYLKLACEPDLVASIGAYFGFVPVLGNIHLWYSPNESGTEPLGSQQFHLDYADTKQCKLFVPIYDIDLDNGPTYLVNANESASIQRQLRYKLSPGRNRISDERVAEISPADTWVALTGARGSLLFADTSRCFHFGSRDGVKPRLVLMIQYLSPCAFTLDWDHARSAIFSKLDNPTLPNYQRALLGAF